MIRRVRMKVLRTSYRGCLLGLAVGDAMGYAVDSRSWQEIREDYGPNGLLGYDVVNGYADITSHTQLAAFTLNGLLLGMTRGQMTGKMAPFVKYIGLAQREWAASQRPWGRPDRTFCWLMQQPELCRRHCMDTRMLETLMRDPKRGHGTPETPINTYSTPGALCAAVGVGMFCDPERMEQEEIDWLGAEAVALTHGSPSAFLAGAALAHLLGRVLRAPNASLGLHIKETLESMKRQYGHRFSQVYELCNLIQLAQSMAANPQIQPVAAMEQLECWNGSQALAGAIYACLRSGGDFDSAMILAVNHSGRSAAVGAVTGAILGARLGEEALPEFYVECLEPAELLRELSDDLYNGCPMELGNRLFDLDWDRKYLHGGR